MGDEVIHLPDCTFVPEEPTDEDFLSLLPRSEVVRALAERGIEGALELLKREEARGGDLGRRIASFRERLRRQAARSISRLTRDYAAQMENLESVRVRSRKLLKEEMDRLRDSLEKARAFSQDGVMGDANLLEAVRSALLLPSDALKASLQVKKSLWLRIREWFARLWAMIRRLFGRGSPSARPTTKKAPGRPLTLARLAFLGRSLTPDMTGDLFGELTPAQIAALKESAQKNLASQQRELEKKGRSEDDLLRRKREQLQGEEGEAKRQAEKKFQDEERRQVEQKLRTELSERGWVSERGGHLAVTYALVERFARLMLEEEEKALPEGLRLSLRGQASTGLYERGRMRELIELSRMDLPGSLLQSRMRGSRHLLEEESYVYREIRSESLHAVLLLDVSGSMAEGGKITAAKKALLALYMAIHRRYPDSIIDIVAFDSQARALDLVELWEVDPGSFTNTGEALHIAYELLRSSRATRKELYLITDGLPESYTEPGGVIRSGNLDRALAYATARARELATVQTLVSTLVLLKSDNPTYEKAARTLANVLKGYVVVTDPRRLAFELLVRFSSDRVVETEMSDSHPETPRVPVASPAEVMARSGTSRERRKARRQTGPDTR
jgi:Mg-chelatase subunit ChlD